MSEEQTKTPAVTIKEYPCYNYDCQHCIQYETTVPETAIVRPKEQKEDTLTTFCLYCVHFKRFNLFSPSVERKIRAI